MTPTARSRTSRAAFLGVLASASALAGAVASEHGSSAGLIGDADEKPVVEVIRSSEIPWGALNPARGDKGPRAADLWGDRTGTGSTGLLVRFAEGFSSPPHIHNVTYRGVVIEGLIHNDDPGAEPSWMPAGSYWTQPAGEVHITAAKGNGRLAYIEIQQGPYLVLPAEEAEDNGERAVNLHASNVVWLDASSAARIAQPSGDRASEGPRVSYLWGDPQGAGPSAALVELPAGTSCTLESEGDSLRVVVVKGAPRFIRHGDEGGVALDPGSYVGSQGRGTNHVSLSTDETCLLYVRSEGAMGIVAGGSR